MKDEVTCCICKHCHTERKTFPNNCSDGEKDRGCGKGMGLRSEQAEEFLFEKPLNKH